MGPRFLAFGRRGIKTGTALPWGPFLPLKVDVSILSVSSAQKFILKAYLLHYTDLEAGHTKLKRGVDPAVVMLWWGEKTCLRRQGVCITRQGYILGRMQLTVQRFTMGNYFHKKYCKKSRRMLRALPLNTFLPMNTDLKHILKTLKRHYVGTEGIIKGHVQSFAP